MKPSDQINTVKKLQSDMDSTNRALSFLGAATVYAQILGAIFFKNETSNDKYIFKSWMAKISNG